VSASTFRLLSPTLAACLLAGAAELTILHTTDLHGHADGADAGMLRVAGAVQRERDAAGKRNVLLIDCGDTCQGSLAAAHTRGEVSIRFLEALEYDVWVPGNHDFDFGTQRLHELLGIYRGNVLCGNASYTLGDRTHTCKPWRLFRRASATVAVIGMTAGYLENWVWGDNMRGLSVASAADAIERVLPEVHDADPDVIVLAIHQGWVHDDDRGVNEVADIADRFPEIDVIVGGHTHRDMPGMRIGERTWYAQAGKHGRYMGVIRVVLDDKTRKIEDVSSRLVDMGDGHAPDPSVAEALAPWLSSTKDFADKPVGELATQIKSRGTPGRTCRTSEFLCQALSHATAAPVVVHGRLSRYDLPAGKITERDLFELVPFENAVATALLTPPELAEVLEEQHSQRDSYVYCGVYGLEIVLTQEGRLERMALADGRTPEVDERIPVAFNSYTVAGGGGRFPRLHEILRRPDCKLTDLGFDTREAIRRLLRDQSPFRLEMRRWIDD